MKHYFFTFVLLAAVCVTVQGQTKVFTLDGTTRYSANTGHGYDFVATPQKGSQAPFFYSIQVPDGNYLVTVKLGDKKKAGVTTVRAENRRLFINRQVTQKGQVVERSFVVNKRTPRISDTEVVKLKDREKAYMTWDDRLTLEFNGEAPMCQEIRIEPAPEAVTTVYLCGNSTVVDQSNEPWASWGQMIPGFFTASVAVANYAESGETGASFMSRGRLKQLVSKVKQGDYVLIEFGHNDEKEKGPGKGAYFHYLTNLKIFVDEARAKGAYPVLITPTARRQFNDAGTINDTHGEFDDAVRWLAAKENVPMIDLTKMSTTLYETLGVEGSKKALVHYPANTFPHQPKELADNTHFNPYGAYQVAKCVARGIIDCRLPLADHLLPAYRGYSPLYPDAFDVFVWDPAPMYEVEKPDGN